MAGKSLVNAIDTDTCARLAGGGDESLAAFMGPEILGHAVVDIHQVAVPAANQVLRHQSTHRGVAEADLHHVLVARVEIPDLDDRNTTGACLLQQGLRCRAVVSAGHHQC